MAVGIWDDIKGLSFRPKFAAETLAAIIAVFFIELEFGFLQSLLAVNISVAFLVVPVIILWIVGLTNAFNFIDGLDGLATSISMIIALFLFYLTFDMYPLISYLSLILAGALCGFLPYNINKARIFLGDTGSLFLGYTLAVISVLIMVRHLSLTTLLVIFLVFGLPLTDTLLAIVRRLINKRCIFKADKEHIRHILIELGLSKNLTVFVICGSKLYLCFSAVYLTWAGSNYSLLYFMLIYGLFLIIILRTYRAYNSRGDVSAKVNKPFYRSFF